MIVMPATQATYKVNMSGGLTVNVQVTSDETSITATSPDYPDLAPQTGDDVAGVVRAFMTAHETAIQNAHPVVFPASIGASTWSADIQGGPAAVPEQ